MHPLVFTPYTPHHYPGFRKLMQLCYSDLDSPLPGQGELDLLSRLYFRGQILCLDGNEVVGAIISRVAPYSLYSRPHTEAQALDIATYERDHHNGDVLYCLDLFAHPAYAGHQLGKRLHKALQDEMKRDNFSCILGTSRVVGYAQQKHQFSLPAYIEAVKNRTLFDPILSFHIRHQAVIMDGIPHFSPSDTASAGAAVLIKVVNPEVDLRAGCRKGAGQPVLC